MRQTIIAIAIFLALAAVVAGQVPGGVPAKAGQASFKFGGTQVTYGQVTGDFRQSYGFNTISLTFSQDGKPGSDHLSISLMIQKPGPVDMNQPMGNGIGYWTGGSIFAFQKGKSQCTMTVTKLTEASVEGTAECPVVNETGGQKTGSLTAVKFSASTK